MSTETPTTKTATFVKKVGVRSDIDARLYRLDPPLAAKDWDTGEMVSHEYVRTSATVVMFSGPETYIFPADENGEVTDWGELEGSYKGGLDHEEALRGAGYEVAR